MSAAFLPEWLRHRVKALGAEQKAIFMDRMNWLVMKN